MSGLWKSEDYAIIYAFHAYPIHSEPVNSSDI